MTITIDVPQMLSGLVKLMFAGVIFAIVLLGWFRIRHWFASRKFDFRDLKRMRNRWEEIEGLSRQSGEMGRKMAVLEADKLLDQALKSLSMSGNTLGERLKFACYRWPKLRQVWWAHKIRNQLAHEASYHLDRTVAARAIRSFRAALKLIGAI